MKVTLQLLFSTRTDPSMVESMIQEKQKYVENPSKPNQLVVLMDMDQPPFAFITDLRKTEDKYLCDVEIPDMNECFYDCYKTPVIHPAVIGQKDKGYHILFFKIIDMMNLNQASIYDGINLKEC